MPEREIRVATTRRIPRFARVHQDCARVSAMAYGAICHLALIEVKGSRPGLALRELIGGRRPVHVDDFSPFAQKTLGPAMALDAPFHVERVLLPRQRHLIDATMARGATD